jgi:acyl-CoA thioester hydrolase
LSDRPTAHARAHYRHFLPIQTRWSDNDAYGHVNNVVYYSWFDTVVNEYLIAAGALDIQASAVVGLVVETQCNYFSELAFPQRVDAGLRAWAGVLVAMSGVALVLHKRKDEGAR